MKERDEPIEFDDKTFNQSQGGAADNLAGAAGSLKQEFSNPIAILRLRLQKVIATNKDKK